MRVLDADGFSEVAKVASICEVELSVLVVGDYPWKNGILGQVVEGPSGECVDEHEIMEIRHLALDPLLRNGMGRDRAESRGETGPQSLWSFLGIS